MLISDVTNKIKDCEVGIRELLVWEDNGPVAKGPPLCSQAVPDAVCWPHLPGENILLVPPPLEREDSTVWEGARG